MNRCGLADEQTAGRTQRLVADEILANNAIAGCMQNRRFKNQSLMKKIIFERARILLSFPNFTSRIRRLQNDTNRRFNTRRLFLLQSVSSFNTKRPGFVPIDTT